MDILLLSEGNAEARDSWSGSSKSIVDELRRHGQSVITRDVELYGATRMLGAATTFSPDRLRWRMRYRLEGVPFRLRSRNAGRHIASHHPKPDVILQIGATFQPEQHGRVPYGVICDSNILLSQHGASTGHSEAVVLKPREVRAIAAREAAIYRGAAAIFTLSERTRRSFIEDFGVPADRVRAIYGGPNFDPDMLEQRAPNGSQRPPTVLFVGRQFARKGGDILLAAFRKARARVPDAELIVIGPDQIDGAGAGVRSLGFVNKATPSGWRTLVEAYANADVFCLPTRFEAFGVAYIEAMHFGLPCIGTNVWAVPEIIDDGRTGHLVEPDDVDTLAERLVTLLSDRELARRMGLAGRERARRMLTWSSAVERMLETLNARTGAVMTPAVTV